jgi:hypothetical protein
MARAGHRYPLIVYRHLVSRWWFALVFMGIVLFGWAYVEYRQPPGAHVLWPFFLGPFLVWPWELLIAIGSLAILVGIFFWSIRYLAYVQPYPHYLKLVTPFLRINISYKRIQKTTATEMRYLFSLKSFRFIWMFGLREVLSQVAHKTALVIDLNGYPISPAVLRLFLSRFFFKDKTPHLVILVQDWMRFSSELDSMRSGIDPNPPVQRRSRDSILARLPRK